MPAIAATLRAQAADSARDHDSTAPAPEVPVAEATNDSNIVSMIFGTASKVITLQAFCGQLASLWTTPPRLPKYVVAHC